MMQLNGNNLKIDTFREAITSELIISSYPIMCERHFFRAIDLKLFGELQNS